MTNVRDSLKHSVNDSPVKGFEKYPKGSIVLCNECAKPIFKMDYAICLGDKAGKTAEAFKPVSLADLAELAGRVDVDAGVRAMVNGWDIDARKAHVASLKEMRAGDPMMCPCCQKCFVQVIATEKHEVLDRAYTIELLTIPPFGAGTPSAVRGRRLGATKDWLHEGVTVH